MKGNLARIAGVVICILTLLYFVSSSLYLKFCGFCREEERKELMSAHSSIAQSMAKTMRECYLLASSLLD